MTTDLVRPFWNAEEHHLEKWKEKDITVVICERDTADILKLCIESLLRFYPDIPILIVDGGSTDDSLFYVRYKAKTNKNIKLWERVGRNGHGTMLDEAIRGPHIKTKYVLLLDSDVIVRKGGWIEDMLAMMNATGWYALGSLMEVTFKGDACGPPQGPEDVLQYTHPSCSIINRFMYLTMEQPFVEHGAPLVYNMQEAQKKGYEVRGYPIGDYVAHLSGASWTSPKTVWKNDMGVLMRPMFTFILPTSCEFHDTGDYEVLIANRFGGDSVVVHFVGYFNTGSFLYPLRFKVRGEYICVVPVGVSVPAGTMTMAESIILEKNVPDEFGINGLLFVKRELWQIRDALL